MALLGGGKVGNKIGEDGKDHTKTAWWQSAFNAGGGTVPVADYGPKPGAQYGTNKDTAGTPPAAAGGGGGGGGGGIQKSNDAPQVAALMQMINAGFANARDTKLANIDLLLGQQDKILLDGYATRAGNLAGSRLDNDKAEADTSFANLVNRARESVDILDQAAVQGAGESDTLRAGIASLRNWDANQADINRSYFDTVRGINTATNELNADTRNARFNLYGQALSDKEQIHTNFFNQMTDAYTQLGNVQANKYSDSYKKGSDAFTKAAEYAGTAWKNPGVQQDVADWSGSAQAVEGRLNNTDAEAGVTSAETKKPSGAKLRKW